MTGGYSVVTICGSMKLADEMLKVAERLTQDGKIVLMPFATKENATAEMLDEMHRRKIDMSDRIVVVVRGNYIGQSTRSEIAYAAANGKLIDYIDLDPLPEALDR